MRRGKQCILAGSLLMAGALLTGCPEESTSSVPARPTLAKVRDYLFPTSATATYVYERTTTMWRPSSDAPDVSTRSFQIKTHQLTADQAVIVESDLPEPLMNYTSTSSFKAAPDGTVTMSMELSSGRFVELLHFPDATLTKAGAIVFEASGSLPAVRVSRMGAETVTVPAGQFETLKVKEQDEGDTHAPTYSWLAKGMTMMGVKQTSVSTYSSELDSGISTTSTEVVLKSYTP